MDQPPESIEQLTAELAEARQRIAELEALTAEQEQGEQALAHERYLLRTLIDNLPDVIYFKDRESRFIIGNKGVAQLLGAKELNDFVGKTDFDYYPHDLATRYYTDEQEMIRSGQTLLSQEEPGLNMTTGEQRWLATIKVALRDNEGNVIGLVGIGRDITERKRTEEELQRYREHLEELVEERTARLQAANEQLQQEITRRIQAEAGLRQYAKRLKILQDIDRSILAAQSAEAIAQAALQHIQHLVPCMQAQVIEFDFSSGLARTLASARSNGGTGFEALTPLEVFGVKQDQPWQESQIVIDIRTLAEPTALARHFQAQGSRSYILAPMVAREELIGVITLSSDRSAAFGPEHIDIAGEVANQLAVAIQQARLHEQVRRYAGELEQRVAERTVELQESNAELESFSYSVSHDLRAPLRAMQGFADALLEDYADQLDPIGQEYGGRIIAAAQRMDVLIQDLLAYSRLTRASLWPHPISLSAAVNDVLTQLESELYERHARVTIGAPLPEVMGHHATLVQALANLVTNAAKFVAPGIQPDIVIRADTREGWVHLEVQDNGIGIEPEHQERIFRVFERLHGVETYPGTGIGLAIVRKGVTRMGGRVGVESTPDQGSTFWLELPAVEPKPEG